MTTPDSMLPQSRPPVRGTPMDAQIARAAQEVQAAVVLAKKFPRDITAATSRILGACKRKAVAETALYAFPKGKQMVTGPSIRLAEVLAQNWGNLDFGIRQLGISEEGSSMEAFCWDLETNVRQTRQFTVPHERHTKKKNYALTDPRDIYEATANAGARRLRSCILGIIPGDIVEEAVKACDATLKSQDKGSTEERIAKMVPMFEGSGVSVALLEKRLGHKISATTETELVTLRRLYASLRDGMTTVDEAFDTGGSEEISETQSAPSDAVRGEG